MYLVRDRPWMTSLTFWTISYPSLDKTLVPLAPPPQRLWRHFWTPNGKTVINDDTLGECLYDGHVSWHPFWCDLFLKIKPWQRFLWILSNVGFINTRYFYTQYCDKKIKNIDNFDPLISRINQGKLLSKPNTRYTRFW